MANRIYVPFTLFNMRMVNMQYLWTPSTEYMGKPTQKPNYFGTCILDRTQQNWWDEPALAPAVAAYSELLQKAGYQWGHINNWPVKDGNMPPEPGKPPSEWAKNRWIIGGSSSSAIKVDIAQPNGTVTALPAKVGVKPGDYVALGMSAAIKQNDAQGVKNYLNTVLFMGAGEEIAVGAGGVTGAEMMAAAQAQGIAVQGFQPAQSWQAPGGGGFTPQPGGAHGPGPGFSHGSGGFAPQTAGPAPAQFASPPNGTPPGGGYASPSSSPQGAPGFMPQGPQPGFAPSPGPGGATAGGQYSGAPQVGNAAPSSPNNGQWQAPPNFAGPGAGQQQQPAPGGWTPPGR